MLLAQVLALVRAPLPCKVPWPYVVIQEAYGSLPEEGHAQVSAKLAQPHVQSCPPAA